MASPRKGLRRNHGSRRLEIEQLECRRLLAAQPIITEFLASNEDGLLDGNGISSDWIEIFNAGDSSIDLSGWYLTDDASDLTKWEFPNLSQSTLDVSEYLVIFASGNGIVDPAANLHTNFRLSADGEYLALVMPDGFTVVSEFGLNGTNYPEQFADVSYGFEGSLAEDEESIQYFDADEQPGGNTAGLPGGWVNRGAGGGEIGESRNFANEGGALQANGEVNQLATTISGLSPYQSYEVYVFFWDDNSGWNIQAGLENDNLVDLVAASPNAFPIDSSTQLPGSAQFVTGLNVLGQGSDTYDDWVDGNRTLYAAPIGEVAGTETVTVYVDHDAALPQRTWYDGIGLRSTGSLLTGSSPADYLIPTNGNLGLTWTENNFDAAANGFTSGRAAIGYENNETGNANSYLPYIENPELPSGTTSVYLRTEFTVDDTSDISSMNLNLKYDDGFVAYLNGTEVLSAFAPDPVSWNSVAPANRPFGCRDDCWTRLFVVTIPQPA